MLDVEVSSEMRTETNPLGLETQRLLATPGREQLMGNEEVKTVILYSSSRQISFLLGKAKNMKAKPWLWGEPGSDQGTLFFLVN